MNKNNKLKILEKSNIIKIAQLHFFGRVALFWQSLHFFGRILHFFGRILHFFGRVKIFKLLIYHQKIALYLNYN